MSRGFTDWTNLGIFPAQDVEDGVPVGTRMTLVAGRVAKRATVDSEDGANLTEYAREDGMGTLGDVHPWHFWQTLDREKRPMGSWSQAFAALIVEPRGPYAQAGAQPFTRVQGQPASDPRYKVARPSWDASLPWAATGSMGLVMPSIDEAVPGPLLLSADPRLVAVNANGPGEAGTTVVDLDPDGALCVDGSERPGEGGRHARLQSLVRVVAVTGGSAPILGHSSLNGLALNYGLSQQDGALGYGMVFGPATDGGVATGGTVSRPAASAARPEPPDPETGRGGAGFASSGVQTRPRDFGEFTAQPQGGHAIGFMAGAAGGPIVHGCARHRLGADRDGHPMTAAHIQTGALFYRSSDQDGPLDFGGDYPETDASEVPVEVYLSWDKDVTHSWVGGSAPGKWRWWTTVPYLQPQGPTTPGPNGPNGPSTPSGPSGPNSPGVPGRPSTPGASGPTTPGVPGQPTTPGGQPPAPNAPATPGGPTLPPYTGPTPGAPTTPGGPPSRPVTPGAQPWPWWIYPEGPPQGDPGTGGARTPPLPPGRPATPGARPRGPVTPGARPHGDGGGAAQGDLGLLPYPEEAERRGIPGVVPAVGSTTPDEVGLYSILHPFDTAFASLSLRPQLWVRGAPNFAHNPTVGAAALRIEEQTRPTVLSVRAWGAQANGDWDYLEQPSSSRARGGIVNGGVLFSPAEFSMGDYLGINSRVDTDSPNASTYVAMAPGVNLAFGTPSTDGSMADGTKVITRDAATGTLSLDEYSASGTTNILELEVNGDGQGEVIFSGTGALRLPSGTTAERPSSPVTGMVRFNTTINDAEEYDGSSWQPWQTGGGGGGLSAVVDDLTPQLGGDLDVNGQEIQSSGDIILQVGDVLGANKLSLQDNASAEQFAVDSDGNLTLAGTVDGRDVAADGTKLDTVATNADVTATVLGTVTGDVTFSGTVASLAAGSVNTTELVDGAVSSAKIGTGEVGTTNLAAESVTLAKMAQGSAGQLLYYTNDGDGTGIPAGLATGTDGHVLKAKGALATPAWEAPDPASGLGYATICGDNADATGPQASVNTFAQVTAFTTDYIEDAAIVDAQAASDRIQVKQAGKYLVEWTFSAYNPSAVGNVWNVIGGGVALNGTVQAAGRCYASKVANNRPVGCSGSLVINCALNDLLTVYHVEDGTPTASAVQFYEASLTVTLLPGQ